ncbi:MAG: hypothetical protein ACOYXB_04660 [Bacteroidota bacterium]
MYSEKVREAGEIRIQTGSFISKAGYSLKIVDRQGQTVFEAPVSQKECCFDFRSTPDICKFLLQVLDQHGNIIYMEKIHRKDSICI